MSRVSAGLVMYRLLGGRLQVLLVHPGGPFFKNKDEGAWSIPKGETEPDEDLLEAAKREFQEEIGIQTAGPFIQLTPVGSEQIDNPVPVAEVIAAAQHTAPDKHVYHWDVGASDIR